MPVILNNYMKMFMLNLQKRTTKKEMNTNVISLRHFVFDTAQKMEVESVSYAPFNMYYLGC